MKKSFFIPAVLCLFFVLLFETGCGRREDVATKLPSISGSILSEGPFTIGDPIDILFTVISDRESEVQYPREERELSPFAVKAITQKRSRVARNTYRTLIIYTVAVFRTGDVPFPSLSVTVGDRVLKTEPLDIHILSVLPKEEQALLLKDIVTPYRPRTRRSTVLAVLGSLLAASGIAYLLYRLWMNRRSRKKVLATPEKIDPDPYGYSIDQLEQVRAGYMRATLSTKQVYSELSLIMRSFVGSLLRLNAVGMTTGQLSRFLRRNRTEAVPYRRFVNLLKRSDLVKFAKENPKKEKVKTDIEESIGIVNEVHGMAGMTQNDGEGGT
jgi:hypothetical protein